MNKLERALKRPFPERAISWRVGSVTKDGTQCLPLAYIDARDVMKRLDEVFPMSWQCRYTHAEGKTICEIGCKIDGEWIWRAGGAGDTDIEAEKGAISDAFKRAAVLWGIGQYLYDIKMEWFPCVDRKINGTPKLPKWATPVHWDQMVDDHERMNSIVSVVRTLIKEGSMKEAVEVWQEVRVEDVELQEYAWFQFESQERTALNKIIRKEAA